MPNLYCGDMNFDELKYQFIKLTREFSMMLIKNSRDVLILCMKFSNNICAVFLLGLLNLIYETNCFIVCKVSANKPTLCLYS